MHVRTPSSSWNGVDTKEQQRPSVACFEPALIVSTRAKKRCGTFFYQGEEEEEDDDDEIDGQTPRNLRI